MEGGLGQLLFNPSIASAVVTFAQDQGAPARAGAR